MDRERGEGRDINCFLPAVRSKNTTRKRLAIIERKVSKHANKEDNLPLSSSKS